MRFGETEKGEALLGLKLVYVPNYEDGDVVNSNL